MFDYFVNSLNNDERNQMIVCPNHHSIIHDANPIFNRIQYPQLSRLPPQMPRNPKTTRKQVAINLKISGNESSRGGN